MILCQLYHIHKVYANFDWGESGPSRRTNCRIQGWIQGFSTGDRLCHPERNEGTLGSLTPGILRGVQACPKLAEGMTTPMLLGLQRLLNSPGLDWDKDDKGRWRVL